MHNPLQPGNSEKHLSNEGDIPMRIEVLRIARQSVDFVSGNEVLRSIYEDNGTVEAMKKVVAAEVVPSNLDPSLNVSITPAHSLIEDNSNATSQEAYINYLTQAAYDIHDEEEGK